MGRIVAGSLSIVVPARVHRAAGRVAALLAVAAFCLGLMAAPAALAVTGHKFDGVFGSASGGMSARPSTHELFVANGTPQIDVYDAAGNLGTPIPIDGATYNSPSSVAVDDSGAGFVYVAVNDAATGTPTVAKYALTDGSFAGTLDVGLSGLTINGGTPLAVEPGLGSDTVYAAVTDPNTGQQSVAAFDTLTGALVSSFDGSDGGTAFGCISGLGADVLDRVYVLDACNNRVLRYSSAGTFQAVVSDGSIASPSAIAVTPPGEVGIVENGGAQMTRYGNGGDAREFTFGQGSIFCFNGSVAVDGSNGNVYVGDGCQGIVRFVPFVAPAATTEAADGIDPQGATLHGTVNPESTATSYHFEWGQDTGYGNSTDTVDAGNGSADVPASATLSGLAPNTTYHYRLVAANADGQNAGADMSFTTSALPPTVDGQPAFADKMTTSSARLHGTVNPNNSATTYHFEYGTDTSYGQSTPDGDAGSSLGDNALAADLTGLTPGTTYHFRIVADNGTGGPQAGADQVFHTAPAAEPSATAVTATGATLHGTIDPHGAPVTYRFEYGKTTDYGDLTPVADGGSTDGEKVVSAQVAELKPATTYHVRVVATDTATGRTTTGDDGTFTTNPAPVATAGDATGVTTSAATVHGTVDTHGKAGSYRFVVTSADSPYQSSTDPKDMTGAGPVSADLKDLPTGTTFKVKLVVSADGATVTSDEVTFSTAALPTYLPPTPSGGGSANPYGCAAPHLDPVNAHPKPGATVHVTGTDLGVGGTVALGTGPAAASKWSATGVDITIPDDASGTLPLTINCGNLSNTVAVALFKAPSNAFTASAKTRGTKATVRVKVAGAGDISIKGSRLKSAHKHAKRKGTVSVSVRLTSAGKRKLARSGRLVVRATVRFKPNGGSARSKRVRLTFRH